MEVVHIASVRLPSPSHVKVRHLVEDPFFNTNYNSTQEWVAVVTPERREAGGFTFLCSILGQIIIRHLFITHVPWTWIQTLKYMEVHHSSSLPVTQRCKFTMSFFEVPQRLCGTLPYRPKRNSVGIFRSILQPGSARNLEWRYPNEYFQVPRNMTGSNRMRCMLVILSDMTSDYHFPYLLSIN